MATSNFDLSRYCASARQFKHCACVMLPYDPRNIFIFFAITPPLISAANPLAHNRQTPHPVKFYGCITLLHFFVFNVEALSRRAYSNIEYCKVTSSSISTAATRPTIQILGVRRIDYAREKHLDTTTSHLQTFTISLRRGFPWRVAEVLR